VTGTTPSTPVGSAARLSAGRIVLAFAVDVVLLLIFSAIGRANHGEDVFGGLFVTAWPFLVGLVVGWLISRAWLAPFAPLRTGLPVWAIVVVAGMLLRGVSGQGVDVAFVLVAASFLFLFLVGWRAIVALVALVRRRRSS
jgi:hypothetical protein